MSILGMKYSEFVKELVEMVDEIENLDENDTETKFVLMQDLCNRWAGLENSPIQTKAENVQYFMIVSFLLSEMEKHLDWKEFLDMEGAS